MSRAASHPRRQISLGRSNQKLRRSAASAGREGHDPAIALRAEGDPDLQRRDLEGMHGIAARAPLRNVRLADFNKRHRAP
jgi:hypothetical protein